MKIPISPGYHGMSDRWEGVDRGCADGYSLAVLRLALRWLRRLPSALERIREDVDAARASDPAARSDLDVLLTYPGIHALWAHRLAHDLWRDESRLAARILAHASRFVTGVEIHPAARIGRSVFIDHGMGVVIGETATIGDGCLIYKGVVLGGTSLANRVRHPQIGSNVVIGSNACVLGNITVGDGARIGSGSVVVKPVPAGATVVGVPGRLVSFGTDRRSRFHAMLDHANLPDPVTEMVRALASQNDRLRHRVGQLESMMGLPEEPECESLPSGAFFMNGETYPKLDGG
jgi:serine O-acetyltransferase